jgi:purine-binding chemotaxis protein CheW
MPTEKTRSVPKAPVERTKLKTYVTFRLGTETYAFDVQSAREILDLVPITPIPDTPAWVRGVFNLRGNVIPVFDLKQRFGLGATQSTSDTRILILDFDWDGDFHLLGVLADSVCEVLELDPATIEPPPLLGCSFADCIQGIGRVNDVLLVLLCIQAPTFAEGCRTFQGANRDQDAVCRPQSA